VNVKRVVLALVSVAPRECRASPNPPREIREIWWHLRQRHLRRQQRLAKCGGTFGRSTFGGSASRNVVAPSAAAPRLRRHLRQRLAKRGGTFGGSTFGGSTAPREMW
jgi:hypothetical protein